MVRKLSILWIFGVLALLACSPGAPGPTGRSVGVDPGQPGGLAASAPVVDIGRVPSNKQVVADFELVNTGGTPVRLTSAPTVAMLEGC